jgi:hypothetical protein
MTEVDWQAGTDPEAMLNYLAGKASARKLRLFACACVRRHWPRLRSATAARCREAVEAAERHADGESGAADLQRARERAEPLLLMPPTFDAFAWAASVACAADDALEAARNARESLRQQAVREAAYEVPPGQDEAEADAEASAYENQAQCELLREVFGNPFRPVSVDPAWLGWGNGSVAHLAHLIYENGQYADLPYLADALEDAGCTEEGLLRHLREDGGHVRGCWALDAVLGHT